jgi:hypothetical protein
LEELTMASKRKSSRSSIDKKKDAMRNLKRKQGTVADKEARSVKAGSFSWGEVNSPDLKKS